MPRRTVDDDAGPMRRLLRGLAGVVGRLSIGALAASLVLGFSAPPGHGAEPGRGARSWRTPASIRRWPGSRSPAPGAATPRLAYRGAVGASHRGRCRAGGDTRPSWPRPWHGPSRRPQKWRRPPWYETPPRPSRWSCEPACGAWPCRATCAAEPLPGDRSTSRRSTPSCANRPWSNTVSTNKMLDLRTALGHDRPLAPPRSTGHRHARGARGAHRGAHRAPRPRRGPARGGHRRGQPGPGHAGRLASRLRRGRHGHPARRPRRLRQGRGAHGRRAPRVRAPVVGPRRHRPRRVTPRHLHRDPSRTRRRHPPPDHRHPPRRHERHRADPRHRRRCPRRRHLRRPCRGSDAVHPGDLAIARTRRQRRRTGRSAQHLRRRACPRPASCVDSAAPASTNRNRCDAPLSATTPPGPTPTWWCAPPSTTPLGATPSSRRHRRRPRSCSSPPSPREHCPSEAPPTPPVTAGTTP